jgi:serine/threonine protein kinase
VTARETAGSTPAWSLPPGTAPRSSRATSAAASIAASPPIGSVLFWMLWVDRSRRKCYTRVLPRCFCLTPLGGGVVQELQRGDPQRVGPYRLVGRLGSGGMGRVFLGRSAGGRLVAVKLIHEGLAADPHFRARFGREVAAASQVGGLFTALVIDADAEGPTPWLATAYVAGPSLSDAVSTSGPLPPASVLSLAAGLAEGLGAIHAVGLVHRDLKPSNVLLAEDGPRVIDFGISRAAEASALTRTGSVIGSPGFMSPEQAEGSDEIGPASDMFSLGAVLVYAATAVPPFGTGSTAALVFRVVFKPPMLDGVPWQVRPIAERCLDKDPAKRPTPAELLAEFGDVDDVVAWLPTTVRRGFAQQPPSAPADIESLPPSVSPERTAQPASSTTAPDAPNTATAPPHQPAEVTAPPYQPAEVTAPPYQPEESPTAQPAPAAEAAQPSAVEPHSSVAPTADESAIAPQPTIPVAPSPARPPVQRGAAYAGVIMALLSGIAGFIGEFLLDYPFHLEPGAFYFFDLAFCAVVVAAALTALTHINRLTISGYLQGMTWLGAPYLVAVTPFLVVFFDYIHGRSLAGDLIQITGHALAVAAAILLMVSWSPAVGRRQVREIRGLPLLLLGVAGFSQVAALVVYMNIGWDSYVFSRYWAILGGVGAFIVLAVTWYAMSLRVRVLGGALALAWVVVLAWATAAESLLVLYNSVFTIYGSVGAFIALAVTWYAMSLRVRALGGALVLGWVTVAATSLIINTTENWSHIYPRGVILFSVILTYALLATVVALTIIYVRRPSDLEASAN